MRAMGHFGIAGSVCLSVTGCFSYAPYGHPNSFGPPNTAMAPAPIAPGTGPAGMNWVPAGPTLAAPPGTPNAASPQLSAPPPVKKDASSTRDMFEEPEAGKSVPEPRDPANAQPQETTQPFGRNDRESLEERSVTANQTSIRLRPVDEDLSPREFETELQALPDSPFANSAHVDSLATSSAIRSAQFSTEVQSKRVTPVGGQCGVYCYDPENYAWLNGIAEFSRADQSWHLTYSQAPDDSDLYGGEVTLKPSPLLSALRQGGAIQVEGRFVPNQRDRLGKPVYEVVRLVSPATRSR